MDERSRFIAARTLAFTIPCVWGVYGVRSTRKSSPGTARSSSPRGTIRSKPSISRGAELIPTTFISSALHLGASDFAIAPTPFFTSSAAAAQRISAGRWREVLTPRALEDLRSFSVRMVERYFQVLSKACRKADPNHLNLGMRWAGVPPAWAVEGMKFFDVFSLSYKMP